MARGWPAHRTRPGSVTARRCGEWREGERRAAAARRRLGEVFAAAAAAVSDGLTVAFGTVTAAVYEGG